MTDHTLSSLRRRARQTGTVEDRAAVLRVELRHAPVCDRCAPYQQPGRIEWSSGAPPYDWTVLCPRCAGTGRPLLARLHLAAYCGSEAARIAAGLPADGLFDSLGMWCDGAGHEVEPAHRSPPVLSDWVRGLSRWSDLHPRSEGWVLVRAAAAAARVAYTEWAPERCDGECGTEDERDCPTTGAALRAIEAAEAWLACPCAEHAGLAGEQGRSSAPFFARAAASAALQAENGGGFPFGAETGLEYDTRNACAESANIAGEAPVRAAICSALVEWALSEDA